MELLPHDASTAAHCNRISIGYIYLMAGAKEELHTFALTRDNNLSDWNCEDPTRLLSLILEHRIYTWHIRENVLGRLNSGVDNCSQKSYRLNNKLRRIKLLEREYDHLRTEIAMLSQIRYHFCTEETFLWESSLFLRDDVSNVKTGGKLLVDKEEKVNMEIAICDFCHMIRIEGISWAHQRTNNMPGGRTAHSRFKIPINLHNNSMCNIKKQSGTAQLLREAKVIIWDEASMAKRQAIEALDRTMQDISGNSLPFGGKIVVFGGDFRQVLPVIRRGTRAQIVDASLRMSPLWPSIRRLRLRINMRAVTDPWFSNFLLRVGDGEEATVEDNFIRIPDDMAIPYVDKSTSVDALISKIFPSLQSNEFDSNFFVSRAILTTKNENVDDINDHLIESFSEDQKVYHSFDEAEDDRNNLYPLEFLNSLTVGGLPPHYLRLKVGCPVILLRNIDPSNGLCNGTRLICRAFQQNVIDAEIAVGQHAGKRVFFAKNSSMPVRRRDAPIQTKEKAISR
ncbi:hypothetical protein LXL04_001784 [Taraxacum kok-saghyz]